MSPSPKRFSLKELAELTCATLIGNPNHLISGVEDLESASSAEASFLANLRYREAMALSHAGVICIDSKIPLIEGKNFFVSDNPSRTFQKIVEAFILPEAKQSGFPGIHPTAVIHPTAKIGKNVKIAPYVVVDQAATIGEGSYLGPFVSIGPGVQVGNNCHFHAHVVVREGCLIGNRVILQPGAIIGSCGFGYTTDAKGVHTKLDQVGIVVIEDDVEIGANTTIDRARFKETRIGHGTKI